MGNEEMRKWEESTMYFPSANCSRSSKKVNVHPLALIERLSLSYSWHQRGMQGHSWHHGLQARHIRTLLLAAC